ncbi:hypothetical protein CBER1_06139 [Cercospora berteroae]|uniref:SIMPL domain-containing protein n=1 Tax=Cercospora berteroae TaxID=357750 RepID=A0A2S6C3N6_9PEZI|nr:hypothetical protein CBER1_06139 [Cercospora berteroae]
MATTKSFSLKVEGNAEIPLAAERAIINVLVKSEGHNKASVSDEALTAAKHIEKLLREISPSASSAEAKAASPIAHWSKTSLSATSFRSRNDEGELQPRQYRSSITFDIRFKEFKSLGAFGTRISSVPHVELKDIEWILTEETQASYRSQLRRMAAEDATRTAKDYCDALGCGEPRPVELEADGYRSSGRRYHMASQELGGEEDDEDDRSMVLEFTPQEVKMNMDVYVTFHAE